MSIEHAADAGFEHIVRNFARLEAPFGQLRQLFLANAAHTRSATADIVVCESKLPFACDEHGDDKHELMVALVWRGESVMSCVG